jgi:hypothetical protein
LTAFNEGVRFMRSFIEKRTAFDQLAAELSVLIQQYTQVSLEASEETGQEDREQNERIIRDLNREEPHSIDDDFTYRRPHGFILDGNAPVGITTWQRLFELACRQLHQRDPGRFATPIENRGFISSQGHHIVTHESDSLRKALQIDTDLFIECNPSANGIRDMFRRLLVAFELPSSQLQLFLRQDRDAARDRTTE